MKRMKKLLPLFISIIIVGSTLSFVIYRTVTTVKVIKFAERSAINYAEQIYDDVDFKMLSWNYDRIAKYYNLVLYDPKYKGVVIVYRVTPIIDKNGYYYVDFDSGISIDVLKKK